MILTTGANGHLGTAVIEFLMKEKPDAQIAGLVRSEVKGKDLREKGVEIRIGDYFDRSSLNRAMKGIETLLLISTSSMEDRVGQHRNVIETAREAGINHIFYTSMLQADQELSPLAADHHETEVILRESGVPFTINRHTFYTEFFPMFLGDALETGEWTFPSNGEKVNFSYRTEMAEALANELSDPDKHINKVYEITSARAYTLEEYAGILSEATGNTISYKDIPIQTFTDTLKEAGLPDEALAMSKLSAITVANGALAHTSNELKHLLGRKPKDTADFIREFVKSNDSTSK